MSHAAPSTTSFPSSNPGCPGGSELVDDGDDPVILDIAVREDNAGENTPPSAEPVPWSTCDSFGVDPVEGFSQDLVQELTDVEEYEHETTDSHSLDWTYGENG
ncbi:hypothetical protein ANCCAN_02301 [Ancylostoma caninum]|uniref:Uncharacterized protein n=1 Tax=Ancylostoma caninum TaxID=29170 RepID=A0A368H4U7_ANCCA|nr:hypothetical protein ANCCAN_02301 [Ancylostoma caninum]